MMIALGVLTEDSRAGVELLDVGDEHGLPVLDEIWFVTPGVEQLALSLVPPTHRGRQQQEVVEQKREQVLPTFALQSKNSLVKFM